MKMDEQFKKELAKTNKFVDKVYDKMDLFPNPNEEINVVTAEGLTSKQNKAWIKILSLFYCRRRNQRGTKKIK